MQHDGHRARMRKRFAQTGFEGFASHEVLELLLFYAIPRRDVNPLAHRLLDTFGSLSNVLEASPEQLMQVEGLGENAASLISMMVPFFRHYSASLATDRKRIYNHEDCAHFCNSLMAGRRTEHFYVIGLDASSHLLGTVLIGTGDLSEVPAYPRQVVQAALRLNAHSVVLCHNHPGGNIYPSSADLEMTNLLIDALNAIHIRVVDHVIYSRGRCYFMSQGGADLPFADPYDTVQAAETNELLRKDLLHAQEEMQLDW